MQKGLDTTDERISELAERLKASEALTDVLDRLRSTKSPLGRLHDRYPNISFNRYKDVLQFIYASRKKCKKNAQKSVRKKPNPKKTTKRKNNKKIKPPADKQSGISFYYFKIFFAQFAAEPVGKINANQNHRGNHRGIQAGSSRIGPLNSRWQTKRLKWRQCIPPKGRRGTRGAFLQRERAQIPPQ